MPDGFKVASAWVSVSPDLTGFQDDLQAKLDAATSKAAKVKVDPDAAGFPEKLAAAVDKDQTSTKVKVTPDTTGFKEKLAADVEADQAGTKVKVPVEADRQSATQAGEQAAGLMVPALVTGLVASGPLMGAAMAGIGAAGLIGLGAALQKGDPSIQKAWGNLTNDAKVSATAYSSVMVQPITQALDTIDRQFQLQEPLIQHLFASAAADIPIFTDGVVSLTNNALPGFDNALSHSQVIAQGMSSLLGDMGSGLSEIGDKVAGSSGRIGTGLADLGNIVHTVESGVGQLVTTTSGLAVGVLPALDGGLHTVVGTFGALNSLLGPFLPLIGGAGTAVGGAYLAFNKLQPVADKVAASLGSKGGMLGQLSGLAGGIPVVGAAVTGLSLVTGILEGSQEKAIASTNQQASSSDGLTKALSGTTNATQAQIDKALLANAANQQWYYDGTNLNQLLKATGVSQQQFTGALEDGGPALGAVQSKLYGYVDGLQKTYDAGGDVSDVQTSLGQDASQLAGHLGNLRDAYLGSAAATQQQAVQTAQASLGLDHASLNSAQLSSDMVVLGDATSTTSARVTALTDALTLMADHGAEPANDALAQAWSTVNGLGSSLQGATGRLVDTNGQLDLTTTKGEAANTAFENVRNQVAAYAQALSSQGATSDVVRAKTDALISQLIGPLAKALGLSVSQTQTLANTLFGLNSANIVATITADVQPALNAVQTLLNRISHSSASVSVGIAQGAAQKGVQIPQAVGHIVLPMATGGTVSSIPAGIAQVVPPNTPRLIGDNMTSPEAYIPLDRTSRRSQAILNQANAAMGRGGDTTNNWYVTSPDPYQAAQLVAAQQSWNNLLGVHV